MKHHSTLRLSVNSLYRPMPTTLPNHSFSKHRISLNALLIAAGLVIVTSMMSTVAIAQSNDNNLPELGDSATRYLNPVEEKNIGQSFQRKLLRNSAYVSDPELRDYLNQLGNNIASHADLLGVQPEFNLINSGDLNAFAVPGGFITFHTGLILATDTESELAAVLGHEIAHLSQRHLPRLIARTEAAKIPTTAAILASILVGGQAGLAGLTLANAQLISSQLAYTREFEKEADALGIRFLAAADYDPNSMASFFSKIERYGRAQNEQSREFLRTHPLSYIRIAESEARASRYDAIESKNSLAYLYAKAKIRALFTDRKNLPGATVFFRDQISQTEGLKKVVALYGLALAQMRSRNTISASETINSAIALRQNDAHLLLARAMIEQAQDKTTDAVDTLKQLRERFPERTYLLPYLAEALIENDQATEAKRLIRYQLRRDRNNFRLYETLSKANVSLGNLSEAHQADAEFLAAVGGYVGAEAALKLALRESEPDTYLHKSLGARLEQIKEQANTQKKRNR